MQKLYDKRLLDILDACGLNIQLSSDSVKIHNVLMDIFKTKCGDRKTALWGAGRNNSENSHAFVIIKKYTTYMQGLSTLIDSIPDLWGKEFMGYPIISPNEIVNNDIEVIVVSSKVQADSIKKDIKKYAPNCEVVDIYDELRKKGITVYHKFYEESSAYTSIYRIRQDYLLSNDKNVKEQRLKELISAYFNIKDLYYGLKFSKEYVSNQYSDYLKIKKMIEDVEELVREIKLKNQNKKDDVVIYFVDSLRAMDVFEKTQNSYQAKMLKGYLDNAAIFTKVRSTGVTTYESMISVVQEKLPYERNVYDNNILCEFDEFRLLSVAKEQGYDINFFISEGYPIARPTDEINFIKQVYVSEKLWSLACHMAESKNKTFNFIYFPYELHFPLICGMHEKEPKISGFVDVGVEDTSEFVERQLEECKRYVDNQFEYFRTFFSEDILMSLFSDHSQVVYDSEEKKPYFMYYNNIARSVGVTFFIKGWGIDKQWNEQLVSLYDFNTIFINLLKTGKLVIKDNDIVRYQYYRIHYKKLREVAQEKGYTDYIDGINCFTSKDYIYIITATDVEEVYRLENHKINIIDTKEGQAFRKIVREKYDLSFPQFM